MSIITGATSQVPEFAARSSEVSGRPRVVIVGGGFAGLYAALTLRKAPVELTLVDRRNFHLFQPLLYQVATGGLSPGEIASPLRAILSRQKNTAVALAEVTGVDPERRVVLLRDGELPYDMLVIAAGSSHSYFGHDDWEKRAPGLKTIEDALEIRKRIFLAFEAAERETDPVRRAAWLRFVVVGGGPTGVELAGALSEIAFHTLIEDFRTINPADASITLIEGQERILTTYPASLSAKAERALTKLGVTVLTGAMVSAIDRDGVTVTHRNEQQRIAARTVLWGAGVKASPLGRQVAQATGLETDRGGRLEVEPDFSLPGHPEIFVVGDLASYKHQTGEPLPGIAPVAMQQGRFVARLISERVRNPKAIPKPFHYSDRGSLATIGRALAVGQIWGVNVSGWFAWLTWLFIHLMYLVEFENRLLVLIQWGWNYLTRNRSARLITNTDDFDLDRRDSPSR